MGRPLVVVMLAAAACGRIGFEGVTGEPIAGDAIGGEPAASCAAFDVCDGFEAATISAVWLVDPGVVLDRTVAHRGTSSIKFHVDALPPAREAHSSIGEASMLASGVPTFWVRAWFRISVLPAGTNAMELMTIEQTSSPREGAFVFLRNGDVQLYSQFDNRTSGAGAPAPVGTWFCIVWKVTRATDTTGLLVMTSDVLPITVLSQTRTDGSPPVSSIDLGIGYAAPNVDVLQPATDVWMDDVIIHRSPVTCAD